MSTIASRDLRNHTSEVLGRVASGVDVTITVHGRPVALITRPRAARPVSFSRDDFLEQRQRSLADAELRADLTWISADTTDDLGPLE